MPEKKLDIATNFATPARIFFNLVPRSENIKLFKATDMPEQRAECKMPRPKPVNKWRATAFGVHKVTVLTVAYPDKQEM